MTPPRPPAGSSGPLDKTLPTPDPAQVQLIRSYGPGPFLIGERDWRSPVLVTPTATTPWVVTRAEDLTLESLAPLKDAAIPTEFLVLGCGARAIFIPPALRAALKGAGFALEVVDTGAACRLYNVLLAESRRVAAALIPL
ncbi:Mth938-like domain-containing protein [soil metagenome]